MPVSRYVRKGIERDLLRREQGLHFLRLHFTEKMHDQIDPERLEAARESAVQALELHLRLCQRTLADLQSFKPRYFNGRLQKFMSLTADVLEARRQNRLIQARAHADEHAKNKSRKAKSI